MMRYAGVPDVGDTELLDAFQRFVIEVVEFTDTVLFTGAPGNIGGLLITEKAGEHLVDHDLAVFGIAVGIGWRCCSTGGAGQ